MQQLHSIRETMAVRQDNENANAHFRQTISQFETLKEIKSIPETIQIASQNSTVQAAQNHNFLYQERKADIPS